MDGMYDRWTDRLSEYLDEELPPAERAALQAHLAECDDCSRTLDELRAVVASAATLGDREPARDLWVGIAERLESRGRQPRPALIAFPSRRRHFSFTLPQLAAAGIAIVAVSSTIVWLVTSQGGSRATSQPPVAVATPTVSGGATAPGSEPASATSAEAPRQPGAASSPESAPALSPGRVAAAEPPRSARASAARLVRAGRETLAADREYDRAVSDMERLLRKERSRLQPGTVKVLEASLADIDRAIAEARRALARDPANVYLNDHLAESMRLKLELLRTATALTQS